MRHLATSTIAAASLWAMSAHAQTWYADFGVGRATANGRPVPIETSLAPTGEATATSFSYAPLTGSDTMYTARVGARLLPYLAIEAAYARFGDFSLQTLAGADSLAPATFDAQARSAGAAVVAILPLAPVDVYARLGYARTQVKADTGANGSAIHVDDRFNEAYYGAGARWNVTRELGVFAEYQKNDKLDLDGYFVGMQWRF